MEIGLVQVRRLQNFTFQNGQNFATKIEEYSEKNGLKEANFSDNFEKLDKENYTDPLMKWPVRGLAYMNEIGVAISEVAPALGQALWVPTLMYIGADVYDKYKNDDTQYNPSKRRGAKQALFQGLASVTMPTLAVITGQRLFSVMGALSKSKLSLNAKEKISDYAVDFITEGNLAKFANDEAQCEEAFKNGLTNVLKFKENEKKLQDGKGFMAAFLRNPAKALSYSPSPESAEIYAHETISSLMNLRKELLDGEVQSKSTLKWHTLVEKSILKGADRNTAVRDALVKFQKSKIATGKWIKTLGGFIALGLAAKPIDTFVENVILHKYVEPGLDKLAQVSGSDDIENSVRL